MENIVIIGIDPGLSGGICFLYENDCKILKIPTRTIQKNNKNKRDYDSKVMSCDFYSNIKGFNGHVFQELTHAMPGNGGVSMYSFGRGHGIWEGICSSYDVSYSLVTPQSWKKIYPSIDSIKKNNNGLIEKKKIKVMQKQAAIELVKNILPSYEKSLCKTCDGLAESCLIALYGWFKITGNMHKITNNKL